MNARDPGLDHRVDTYLFATGEPASVRWLRELLAPRDDVVEAADPADAAGLHRRIALQAPSVVLVDFAPGRAEPAATLVRELRARHDRLPVLGAGRAGDGAAMLAALRAGVDDFLVLEPGMPRGAADEAVAVLRRLRELHAGGLAPGPAPQAAGRVALLLGARVGLGTTTLATNLVRLLRQPARAAGAGSGALQGTTAGTASRSAAPPEVALLDLGLPGGDGALYLDAQPAFGFVDAVRDLRRMDRTLVDSALVRDQRGIALLPLPARLSQLRDVSHGDAVALVRRLRDFFAVQVVDLGGFTHLDFLAQMAVAAAPDRTWVVCDQSVGAMVSTAALLADLRSRGVETASLRLVVNRHDPQAGIAAADIADRLGLALEAVLPARHAALLGAGLRGEVLADAAPRDAYVRAVASLAHGLRPAASSGRDAAGEVRSGAPADAASPAWRQRIDGLAGRVRGVLHGR
jgi:pilus assembly protein CpaE